MARRYPLWATPDRQTHLVKLWIEYGNKCLLGHRVCPIPSHYIYNETKGVKVAVPVKIPCVDRDKNPIRDKAGRRLYLTVYGTKTVPIYEQSIARLYELKSEATIRDWLTDDRVKRLAEAEAERQLLHRTAERHYPLQGQFSAVSREIFYANQPQYYIVGLSISGLTLKPFAKVRLSSSFVHLYIDLGDTLKDLSRAKKRKVFRYGKPLPYEIDRAIGRICELAVRHYLDEG